MNDTMNDSDIPLTAIVKKDEYINEYTSFIQRESTLFNKFYVALLHTKPNLI